ncbi:MAG: threonine/serine exporter family protein [Mycobacterium sp.]
MKSDAGPAATEEMVGELGLAMLAAGYAVTDIQNALNRVGAAEEAGALSIGVFPSAILTDSAVLKRARIFSQPLSTSLRWDQACEVGRIASDAASGRESPAGVRQRLQSTLSSGPKYPPALAVLGSGLVSGGIAVVFGTSIAAAALALILGMAVGLMLLWAGRHPRLSAVLPLLCGFLVSAAVIGVGHHVGLGPAPLYAVCAPLLMLVPAATITNGVIELAGGDLISGGGRIASGLLIWATLALGVVGGAAAVGADVGVLATLPTKELPGWTAWLALVVMAVGVGLFFSASPTLMITIAVALELSYAIVKAVELRWDPVLAAGVAAAVMLPLLRIVERYRPDLPVIVTFRAAFWLLVPGSLGLVTFTELGEGIRGASALIPVIGMVISISAGVQVGAMIGQLAVPPPGGAPTP